MTFTFFAECLHERDKQYETAKQQLSQMIESQTKLVSEYQAECKELSEKLQEEQQQNKMNAQHHSEKKIELQKQLDAAVQQIAEKELLVEGYKEKIVEFEKELQRKTQSVIGLMNKQNAVMRDRFVLSREVELLKSQQVAS